MNSTNLKAKGKLTMQINAESNYQHPISQQFNGYDNKPGSQPVLG
jgi:hypothetical protein